MENMYFLGIDIGATKSHALITDLNGVVIGFCEGGPGNHEVVGWDGFRTVIGEITSQAATQAGIQTNQISAAGFGIAGYDWPFQWQPHLDNISTLHLECPVAFVNDSILGIIAGTTSGWGVSVISGTGENCWGIDRHGKTGHMTGNSSRMAEYGGAGTIVQRAVQEIAKQWGKRGPATRLTQEFIREVSASDLDDFIEGYNMGKYSLDASHVPLIFETAQQGDQVARNVLHWAGCELADMIIGVTRQLHLEVEPFEIVMVGSTFNGGTLLIGPMKSTVKKTFPQAKFIRLEPPPVIGAAILAMQIAGIQPAPGIRDSLISSLAEFR